MIYRLIRLLIAVPVLRTLLRPRVLGLANVPKTGPVILAANHLSLLDPVLLSAIVKRPISYVVKSEYFTAPGMSGRAQAAFFRALHQVPVDRSGGDAADPALRTAEVLLARGEAFGIFPEGTRSPDGLLHRGRTGVARIALATGAPVIPVGLIGTAQVMSPGSLRVRGGRPEVHFGAPLLFGSVVVPTGEPDAEPGRVRAVTDQVMAAIAELSGQHRFETDTDTDTRDPG